MRVTTRKQLAAAYGVDVKTLLRWCRKAGITLPRGSLLTPLVLAQIQQRIGPWDKPMPPTPPPQ